MAGELTDVQRAAVRLFFDDLARAMDTVSYQFRLDDAGNLFLRTPGGHPYDAELGVSDRKVYDALRTRLLRLDPQAELPAYRAFPIAEATREYWARIKKRRGESRRTLADLLRGLLCSLHPRGRPDERDRPPVSPWVVMEADLRRQLALLQTWFEQAWAEGRAQAAIERWYGPGKPSA